MASKSKQLPLLRLLPPRAAVIYKYSRYRVSFLRLSAVCEQLLRPFVRPPANIYLSSQISFSAYFGCCFAELVSARGSCDVQYGDNSKTIFDHIGKVFMATSVCGGGVWKLLGLCTLCASVCALLSRLCECSAGLFVSFNKRGCALPTCTFSTQLNGPCKIIKCPFTVAGTQQWGQRQRGLLEGGMVPQAVGGLAFKWCTWDERCHEFKNRPTK